MAIMKEQQKDYILEQIIQMDESVQAICTDVQACRNLRAQMFDRESKQNQQLQSTIQQQTPYRAAGAAGKLTTNSIALKHQKSVPGAVHQTSTSSLVSSLGSKHLASKGAPAIANSQQQPAADKSQLQSTTAQSNMLPLFFHLLESIVGNVSSLAEKYASHLISQCPAEVKDEMLRFEERKKEEQAAAAAKEPKEKGTGGKERGGKTAKDGKGKADDKNKGGDSSDDEDSDRT